MVSKSYYTTKNSAETYQKLIPHIEAWLHKHLSHLQRGNFIMYLILITTDMSVLCPYHSLLPALLRIHIVPVVFRASQINSLVMWPYVLPFMCFRCSRTCSVTEGLRSGDCGGGCRHCLLLFQISQSWHGCDPYVRSVSCWETSAQPKAKKSDMTLQCKVVLLFSSYLAKYVNFSYCLTLVYEPF